VHVHLGDREDIVLDCVFQQNVLTVAIQKLHSAVAQIVVDDDRRSCGTQFHPRILDRRALGGPSDDHQLPRMR